VATNHNGVEAKKAAKSHTHPRRIGAGSGAIVIFLIRRGPAFPKQNKICTMKGVGRGTVFSSRSEVTALIKQDIVHHVIERTGLPRTKAEAAVDTVFEGLKEALAAGERIELRGFGVFSVRARKTGIGRNPRTGTEVSITPGKAVRFKPGKELHTLTDGTANNKPPSGS